MGGYPVNRYVMPTHQVMLSDDRKLVYVMQPLPGVSKDDLRVEIHNKGMCLDFAPQKKNPVHKCFPLTYTIDADTAKAEFKDGVLTVSAKLKDTGGGKELSID